MDPLLDVLEDCNSRISTEVKCSKADKEKGPLASEQSQVEVCETCGKKFSSASNLFKHKKIIHEKRYISCEVCAKAFPRKEQLEYHMNSKHGNKTYECKLCMTFFATKICLEKHSKRGSCVRNIMKKRLEHKCTEEGCSKILKTKDSLKKHLESHSKWICDQCGKTYSRSNRLKNHKLICEELLQRKAKRNKKPECSTCGKVFINKYRLIRHQKNVHASDLSI